MFERGLDIIIKLQKIVCKHFDNMTKGNGNDMCTIILVINANSIIVKELALVPLR